MAFQKRRGGVLETSYIQSSFFEEMPRQTKVVDTIMALKVDMEMVNINHETLSDQKVQFSHLIQQVAIRFIHPWVKNLYFAKEDPELP